MDTTSLPKILPSWKGIRVNFAHKYTRALSKNGYQALIGNDFDIGGSGVDLIEKDGELICDINKYCVSQISFNAQVCSLPFFPPNETQISEPCLEKYLTMRNRSSNFCRQLSSMKSKLDDKFEEEISSAFFQLQKCDESSEDFSENLQLRKSIVELANSFPEVLPVPDFNPAYSGGVLATCKSNDDELFLLHPTGKKVNKLAILHLEESNNECKMLQTVDKKVINLKKSPILQVETSIYGFCFVRQEDQCHFINYTDLENVTTTKCKCLENTKYISHSPYFPSELVSVDKESVVQLTDVDSTEVLWKSSKFPISPFLNDSISLLVCDFGSHPRSIVCLTDSALSLYDLRLKPGNKEESILFSSRHFSCSTDEKLAALKRTPMNSFQHFVSSTHHLYVLDERYPSKPVLIWRHPFNSTPPYIDASTYNSSSTPCNTVALLATQESRELAAFSLQADSSSPASVSLSLPLLLSSPSDFAHTLKLRCVNIEDWVLDRLNKPLVGTCVVTHRSRDGFTAFQATSLGDVFYQDFEESTSDYNPDVERTYRVGPGCHLADSRKILPQTSSWLEESQKYKPVDDEQEDILKDFNSIPKIDLKAYMKPSKSSDCAFCNQSYFPRIKKEVLSDTTCCNCGLSEVDLNRLNKTFEKKQLFLRKKSDFNLDFDPFQLREFKDDFSQKLLDLWVPPDVKMDIDMPSGEHSLNQSTGFTGFYSSIKKEMFFDDHIPSSMEPRSLVGETLKTPFKRKMTKKMKTTAGF